MAAPIPGTGREAGDHAAAPWRRLLVLALLPLLLLVAVQGLAQWRDGWFVLDGRFIGPDAYMRSVRVLDFIEGRDWYDGTIERSNAPYGETLHWTRPLDVLILAGAVPLKKLAGLDWPAAVFASGAMVSPLLHVLALLAFLWALRPLFDDRGLALAGFLFAAQFYLTFQFALGRPDHHGLILLLDILVLGFVLRLLGPAPRHADALAAGAVAALVIWVSVEGLVITALMLAALAADWIRRGATVAWTGWIAVAALCLGLLAALVVERPLDDLGAISQDRISILHVGIAGVAVLLWTIALAWPSRGQSPLVRGGVLLGGAALAVAGLAVYVERYGLPRLLAGPMADVHPRVVAEWWDFNKEVSPLLDKGDIAGTLPKFVAHLGMASLALPAMLWQALRVRAARRAAWWLLLSASVAAMALAVHEVRWSGLTQVFLLPGYAVAARWLIDRLAATPLRLAARALVPIVFAVGFLFIGASLRRADAEPPAAPDCDVKRIAGALNERYPNDVRRIASFIFYGPELLYRTSHEVVATPYHRNAAGMLDLIDFLKAEDMEAARRLADRRGIDLVVVCLTNSEADKYRDESGAPSLFSRLERGEAPSWLGEAIPLDPGGGRALAYEVMP